MQNKGSCNRKIPYYNRPIQLLDLAFPVLPHYGKRQNCYFWRKTIMKMTAQYFGRLTQSRLSLHTSYHYIL